MNEEAKSKLYSQLEEFYEYSVEKTPIVSYEEFEKLSDAEILKYVFEYKDNNDFLINGKPPEGVVIELPSMDLRGQDLSGVFMSDFLPMQNIDEPSEINLEGTGCVVDLTSVKFFQLPESRNEYGLGRTVVADLTGCNFPLFVRSLIFCLEHPKISAASVALITL